MIKKFGALFLVFIFGISFNIRAFAYSQNNQDAIDSLQNISDTQKIAYRSLDNMNEAEGMVSSADQWYNQASSIQAFKDCRDLYEILNYMYLFYAEKYYNPSVVSKIENGQKQLELQLKQQEESNGGSSVTLDVLRQQCGIYKQRCHALVNIYNEQKNKADESEIAVAHKEMYNENTKTGFKYVKNNECVYFDKGRLLINEWKEFDDGYRYFGENGLMCHDDWVSGLFLNSKGIAHDTVYDDFEESHFVPYFKGIQDIKQLTHDLRVFGIKCKITYIDAYTKEKDGKVASYDVYDEEGNIQGVGARDDKEYKPLTAVIQIYKYTDRLNLVE